MKEFWTSLGVLAFCQSLLQVVFPPELYLSSFVSPSASRLSLTRAINSSATTFGLSNNDCINHVFSGVAIQWEHVVTQRQSQSFSWQPLPDEKRGFTLWIRKRDKDLILDSYLDYIMDKANDIRRKNQERLDFYQQTGRAWKRGYLLYGKPGMGKLSMITLPGLLNFADGPWSCCGSERIFVFTTNHIEKLHPALLRSGPMDMHIYMSYCSYPALKILRRNYLGSEAEDLGEAGASKLQEVVEKAKMTPADMSEVLIKNQRNKERAVKELREVLKARAERNEKYRGGLREECELNGVVVEEEEEEEEQEKRALFLESPKEGSDCEDDSCKKVDGNNTTITFWGLLNFPDGLWSCCGDERIFMFTTNHIEKLDPELLQSCRMDMHICMS